MGQDDDTVYCDIQMPLAQGRELLDAFRPVVLSCQQIPCWFDSCDYLVEAIHNFQEFTIES
nr:hypothetical protein [uncultured Pseudomonas sp.]